MAVAQEKIDQLRAYIVERCSDGEYIAENSSIMEALGIAKEDLIAAREQLKTNNSIYTAKRGKATVYKTTPFEKSSDELAAEEELQVLKTRVGKAIDEEFKKWAEELVALKKFKQSLGKPSTKKFDDGTIVETYTVMRKSTAETSTGETTEG